jgi:hypothetical protein
MGDVAADRAWLGRMYAAPLTAYPQVEIPAAATTIARRLDRAGLDDTDNAATAAWLHDLETR